MATASTHSTRTLPSPQARDLRRSVRGWKLPAHRLPRRLGSRAQVVGQRLGRGGEAVRQDPVALRGVHRTFRADLDCESGRAEGGLGHDQPNGTAPHIGIPVLLTAHGGRRVANGASVLRCFRSSLTQHLPTPNPPSRDLDVDTSRAEIAESQGSHSTHGADPGAYHARSRLATSRAWAADGIG